jgi:hypothetical protein
MRGLTIRLIPILLTTLALAGCSRESAPTTGQTLPAAEDARVRAERARHTVMDGLHALETAVGEARRQVAAAESGAAGTRAQPLAVSDLRRSIVVANVSLQKARTALVAGDLAAASAALEGSVQRLQAAREGKSTDSPTGAAGAER